MVWEKQERIPYISKFELTKNIKTLFIFAVKYVIINAVAHADV
jgi:hypothetical protein